MAEKEGGEGERVGDRVEEERVEQEIMEEVKVENG